MTADVRFRVGLPIALNDGVRFTEFPFGQVALNGTAFIDSSPYAICLGPLVIIRPFLRDRLARVWRREGSSGVVFGESDG